MSESSLPAQSWSHTSSGRGIEGDSVRLPDLVQDTIQFIQYFQYALENFPLQVYMSGLLFSPSQSILRNLFQHEAPEWISIRQGLSETWPSERRLECKTKGDLLFSPSSKQLATVNITARLIVIWDATSGRQLCNIQLAREYTEWNTKYSWVEHDALFAIGQTPYSHLELWCTESGRLLKTIQLQDSLPCPSNFDKANFRAAFSANGLLFARYGGLGKTAIYHTMSEMRTTQWIDRYCPVSGLLLWNPDNVHFAGFGHPGICVWDSGTGALLNYIIPYGTGRSRGVFSPNGDFLALFFDGFEVWNWSKTQCIFYMNQKENPVQDGLKYSCAVTFNPSTGTMIVSAQTTLREFNSSFNEHHHIRSLADVKAMACSPDGRLIAAITGQSSITIVNTISDTSWDRAAVTPELSINHFYLHGNIVILIARDGSSPFKPHFRTRNFITKALTKIRPNFTFEEVSMSADRCFAAFYSRQSNVVQIWSIQRGTSGISWKLDAAEHGIQQIAWDGENIRIMAISKSLMSWSVGTGELLGCWSLQRGFYDRGPCIHFCPSSNFTYVVTSFEHTINIFKPRECTWHNFGRWKHTDKCQIVFSQDETLLAYLRPSGDLLIWNLVNMGPLFTIPSHGRSCQLSIDSLWLTTCKGWYKIPTSYQPDKLPEHFMVPQINIDVEITSPTWIRSNEQNLIWIPGAYRPRTGEYKYWDVEGDRLAISLGHDVLVLDFLREHWPGSDKPRNQEEQSPRPGQPQKGTRRRYSFEELSDSLPLSSEISSWSLSTI